MAENRVKTGIKGLDEMLGGGLPEGSVTVVKGPPGTGKTLLGLSFVANGATQFGEPGVIVSFDEFSEQIFSDAASIGFDLEMIVSNGLLEVMMTSPAIFLADIADGNGQTSKIITKKGVKRVFIDSLVFSGDKEREPKFQEKLSAMVSWFKKQGVTAFLAQESETLLGAANATDSRLAIVADNLILLNYVEIKSELRKSILVLKERASKHDMLIREFEITDQGYVVMTPFVDSESIMTGTPRQAARDLEKFLKK
jgi:circadian clock protein KaiC